MNALDISAPFRIVCLSHLMWEETLFQRPQQLMTRFQRMGHPVAYLTTIGARRWLKLRRSPGAAPMRGVTADGLRFRTLPSVPLARRLGPLRVLDSALLFAAIAAERRGLPSGQTVLWYYYPGTGVDPGRIGHDLLVYDVMDHFTAFRHKDGDIEAKEERLLRRADVVFTGGRSLHEKKIGVRPDAHCFPSGVDVEHFARAMKEETPIPPDVAALSRPILGYFGAIDERIDYALVEAVCRARPNWSYVFLGPLVAMDRAPVNAPNFHYLGPKPYARLPEYLRAFDVATMPWVQSELTAHISPTKTPEYLAGGKLVVSTPAPDVERDYGDVVAFARTAQEFVAACERCLKEPLPDLAASLSGRAAAASWDTIAQRMREIILVKLREKR